MVNKNIKNISKNIRDNTLFQWLVIFIILSSSLTIGMRTYEVNKLIISIVNWLDLSITLFFLFELAVRIMAEKKWYKFFSIYKGWNWFDLIIVLGSLVPIEDSSYILLARLLRLFRVMRLISFVPQLRMLTSALLIAIPRMCYVLVLMFVIFYIYAVFGSLLFEDINEKLWGDVGIALLTLFRVATLEDWTDVMYETMSIYPLSWLYYLSFIFLSAFIFLNMMIGIVINVLEEEHQRQISDDKSANIKHAQRNIAEECLIKIDCLKKQIDKIDKSIKSALPKKQN